MSIEAMKRIKSFLQDTKMIDSHTISAVVAECDMVILAPQPDTPKPVGFTYQAEIDYANSTGGNGSFWRVPPDLDDESVPLYTHPAPSVPADVVRDAERYRFIRDADVSDDLIPDIALYAMESLDEYIDAAMLTAKDSK